MSGGKTHAALIAQGRTLERADVIAQLRQSRTGAQAISTNHQAADVGEDIDIALYVARVDALIGTLEAGCHVGIAGQAKGDS